jgi:hypothetical protein
MILGGSQIIDCLFLLLAVSREHRNLNRLPATLCSIVGAYHRVEPIALLVHGSPSPVSPGRFTHWMLTPWAQRKYGEVNCFHVLSRTKQF